MNIELNKVSFEEKDDIGYIVINDPPANKMTSLFLKEFIFIVRQYVAQSRVKGIIITGSGRHYSSGADVEQLKEIVATQCMLDSDDNLIAYPMWYQENRATFNFFNALNIPVISAIKGLCIGSGFELALCSHIRICGTGSTLGLPESTFGFLPGVTGTLRYLELIGLGKALELVLSGETFSPEAAMEMGLIDGVVNKKETLTYCEELMRYILQMETPYSKENISEYIESFNKKYKNNSITV
ncbi:enoyl-CoA hydratase/isomerase family protein [Clostridium sp. DJ247]|uniref:enoyl-CoA hydratase/isomerase family protein n=1 Tax=Clostridium sp. DJ247 TaxID=2726188 RepID=UPI00162AC425|nr:enoyl-CoA hydratase/isomerase family protein [Clostridium sp. DJ247]MBC2581425.1 enoyl-CoA hydratase/isomerase family protein [Clostridium sp. DJ247]